MLSLSTLATLPTECESPPLNLALELRQHGPSIVHFGNGSFFKAFLASFANDAITRQHNGWRDMSILAVNMHSDSSDHRQQDGLYAVKEVGVCSTASDRVSIIASVVDCVCAKQDFQYVAKVLLSKQVHTVSLTITAPAYVCNQESKDCASRVQRGCPPTTVWGFLFVALKERRTRGVPPFRILSCDNLPRNGACAKDVLCAYSSLLDKEMSDWIRVNVFAPNTAVDRIVFQRPTETKSAAYELGNGVHTSVEVLTEKYKLLVVDESCREGSYPFPFDGLPGVLVVDDASTFSEVKLRVMNGIHYALACWRLYEFMSTRAYEQRHASLGSVPDFVNRPLIAAGLRNMLFQEVVPHLLEVRGLDVSLYARTVLERIGNPKMDDPIGRLLQQPSRKIGERLLKSIHVADESPLLIFTVTACVMGIQEYFRKEDWMKDCLVLRDSEENVARYRTLAHTLSPEQFCRAVLGALDTKCATAELVNRVCSQCHDLARYGFESTLRNCIADAQPLPH